MGDIITNIERFFKQKTVLSTLIAINISVFLLLKIAGIICLLFTIDSTALFRFFELPSSFQQLLHYPWTLITYMFTHLGFWHIVFNLLCLFWFGKLFLYFFGQKQLGGVYISGGIIGGLLYIVSYNLFPYFQNYTGQSYLTGASASIMAVVFAAAIYRKEYEVKLLFIGRIKLIYIAVFFFILDLLSIGSDNPGGHIAHIGGAIMGFSFAKLYTKGTDLTTWINATLDRITNILTKKPKRKTNTQTHRRTETDYEYNKRKSDENKEIDRILDKIKKSGYACLSENEKKTLFNANKK